MLINSLLACFILASPVGIAQCVDDSSGKRMQNQQNQASQKEYIRTVIYFETSELDAFVDVPKVEVAESEGTKSVAQVFVIRREK